MEIAKGSKMRHTAIPTEIPRPATISTIENVDFISHEIPQIAIGNRGNIDVIRPGA